MEQSARCLGGEVHFLVDFFFILISHLFCKNDPCYASFVGDDSFFSELPSRALLPLRGRWNVPEFARALELLPLRGRAPDPARGLPPSAAPESRRPLDPFLSFVLNIGMDETGASSVSAPSTGVGAKDGSANCLTFLILARNSWSSGTIFNGTSCFR